MGIGKRLALTVAAATVLAGCASTGSSEPERPTAAARPALTERLERANAAVGPGPAALAESPPTKVLVVVDENHSLRQMLAKMPYLSGLSTAYGYATRWSALTHPSEPNYLGIVGGSTFGITDDHLPVDNATKVGLSPSVFSQARQAGRTAGVYAESMPTSCATQRTSVYATALNPWTFFAADRVACRAHDVNADAFPADARANRLPNVGFLIPNLLNDGHNGSLVRADAWLGAKLAPVLASQDFTAGRLVVVVTADEDDYRSGNVVLTSVLTPRVHHRIVNTPLTHYSLTRFIDQVLGVAPLGQARTAPDLAAAFGLDDES